MYHVYIYCNVYVLVWKILEPNAPECTQLTTHTSVCARSINTLLRLYVYQTQISLTPPPLRRCPEATAEIGSI